MENSMLGTDGDDTNPNPSTNQTVRAPEMENVEQEDDQARNVIEPHNVNDKVRLMARIWRDGRDLGHVVPLSPATAVKHETDKAVLLSLDMGLDEMWVPKSQLCVVTTPQQSSGFPALAMPVWMAEKKDLLTSPWTMNMTIFNPVGGGRQPQCNEIY